MPSRLDYSDDDDGEHSGSEPDDPTDGDYVDSQQTTRRQLHEPSLRFQGSLINAMDGMNALMMYMNGITPDARAKKWQKEEDEHQKKNQEVSQGKVLEWMSQVRAYR